MLAITNREVWLLMFLEADEEDLIWRGLGTSVLKDYSDPENMQKAANEFVSKVLKDFPPTKK